MANSSGWRSLKISSGLLFLGLPLAIQAQSWKQTDSKSFDTKILAVSLDLQKNIYVAFADDEIIKFDEKGEALADFAQPNLAPIALIEAQNSLNPFFFVRDNQQVVFLDRFLANPTIYDLNQWTSSFVWMATPSMDRQLWLLESDPFRVAKVDRFTGNVLHEVYIQIGFDVEDLLDFRAQQQNLLLVDQYKGIYLFDLFGNLIRHVVKEEVTAVQLVGNQLTYFAEGTLYQLDLRTGQQTEKSLPDRCDRVIRNGESYLCIGSDQIDWYKWVK